MSAKWFLAPALACALLGATAMAQSAGAGLPTTSSGKRPVHVPAAVPLSPSAPIVFPVLYTQVDNDSGIGVVSQDFETANDGFDSEGADDFVVPPGVTWAVMSVTANGAVFQRRGPGAGRQSHHLRGQRRGPRSRGMRLPAADARGFRRRLHVHAPHDLLPRFRHVLD